MTPLDRATVWATYPFRFATEALGLEGDETLRRYLEADADAILDLGGRQVGKTTRMAVAATHKALFSPGSLSMICSATLRQGSIVQSRVAGFLRSLRRTERWRKIKSVDVPSDPLDEDSQLIRCSVMSLEIKNGSEVISTPASADTVRGYSPDLLLMDEAARIGDGTFHAASPALAVTGGRLIAGSSAGAQRGWFFDAWRSEDGGWLKIATRADECGRISTKHLEQARRRLPKYAYEAEYENVFAPVVGALLTAEQIAGMFTDDFESILLPWQRAPVTTAEDVTW